MRTYMFMYIDIQIHKYDKYETWHTLKKHDMCWPLTFFWPQKTLWTMTSKWHKPTNTSLKWTLAPLAPGVLLRDPRVFWIKVMSHGSVTRNLSIRVPNLGKRTSFTQVLVVFNLMILEKNVQNTTVSQWHLWIIQSTCIYNVTPRQGKGTQRISSQTLKKSHTKAK